MADTIKNLSQNTIEELTAMRLGIRVDKAAISVAGATTKDLFTVNGGRCIITGLIAESTTGQAAGANNAKYIANPTAVGTNVDLCATADIASTEIGGLLHITGVFANAMVATAAGAGGGIMMTTPVVVAVGGIGFNTDADTAGSFKFSIWYVPAEDGAYIAAA
jgi:hypothetical protein